MRWLYQRGLAAVYWTAFRSLGDQVLGLYGRRGIAPIAPQLDAIRAISDEKPLARLARAPTLLWWDASDKMLLRLCRLGELGALGLGLGVWPRGLLASLWALYLSLVVPGREFLAFQWDALLLEAGLDALVSAPSGIAPGLGRHEPPRAAILLHRLLVLRLHLQSGLAKLQSGDPTWRDGSALAHHFETQPLPTRLAFRAHALGPRAQHLATWSSIAVELVVPPLALGPRRARRVAFASLVSLQIAIAATGNYGFFNLLSALECLWLLDDDALAPLAHAHLLPVPRDPRRAAPRPSRWRRLAASLVALPVTALSLGALLRRLPGRARVMRRLPSPVTRVLGWLARVERRLAPLRAANAYGLFAVMTTIRPEIVIEGSDDGVDWRPYELPYKPGDPERSPRRVAPLHPRLDWQLWFAALSWPPSWFESLLVRLLEGAPEVLALFASNPFATRPPRFVRAVLYRYHMNPLPTVRATGAWWRRERLGLYYPPVSLLHGDDGARPLALITTRPRDPAAR